MRKVLTQCICYFIFNERPAFSSQAGGLWCWPFNIFPVNVDEVSWWSNSSRAFCVQFYIPVTPSSKADCAPHPLSPMLCGLRVNIFGRSSWSLPSIFFPWLFYLDICKGTSPTLPTCCKLLSEQMLSQYSFTLVIRIYQCISMHMSIFS